MVDFNYSGFKNDLPQFLGNVGNFFASQNFKNPADSAMPYLQQIPDAMSPYFTPFFKAGTDALPALQAQFAKLLEDPAGFLSKIGSSYQQSPGYKFQVDQATGAANRAAAAGGMLGSPAEQQQLAGTVNQLANQDYNNWLDHALKMYLTGIGGDTDLAHMGQQAGSQMGQMIGQNLENEANLAYEGQNAQNQASGGGWGNLMGAIGEAAKYFSF